MAYVDRHTVLVDATPDRRLGGRHVARGRPALLRAPAPCGGLRGLADGLLGGPGWRITGPGRPLEAGDAMDFWEVVEVHPPTRLRLRARDPAARHGVPRRRGARARRPHRAEPARRPSSPPAWPGTRTGGRPSARTRSTFALMTRRLAVALVLEPAEAERALNRRALRTKVNWSFSSLAPGVCMTTTQDSTTNLAAASGSYRIGGDLPVVRLGYGTMQLPGEGVWGPAKDYDGALRRAAPGRRDRRDLLRHRRLLRPRGRRGPAARRAAPLRRRRRDRHQGRPDPSGPRRVDPGRPPGVPPPAVRALAAPARRRADRPVPAAPDRRATWPPRTRSAS